MAFRKDVYEDYKNGVIQTAYELYPETNEAYNRIMYVKDKVPKDVYNMFLLETVQWEYSLMAAKKVNFTGNDIGLICRSMLTAIANIDSNTEVKQYEYMLCNHEKIFLSLLKELRE